MLWRAKYDTWEALPALLPEVAGVNLEGNSLEVQDRNILLGAFDLRAQAEIGVWRRLLKGVAPADVIWTIFFTGLSDLNVLSSVQAMTSKSLWSRTGVAECTDAWSGLIQPDRLERSFAGLIIGSTLDPLMIGIPTEDAWDRFRSHL